MTREIVIEALTRFFVCFVHNLSKIACITLCIDTENIVNNGRTTLKIRFYVVMLYSFFSRANEPSRTGYWNLGFYV